MLPRKTVRKGGGKEGGKKGRQLNYWKGQGEKQTTQPTKGRRRGPERRKGRIEEGRKAKGRDE